MSWYLAIPFVVLFLAFVIRMPIGLGMLVGSIVYFLAKGMSFGSMVNSICYGMTNAYILIAIPESFVYLVRLPTMTSVLRIPERLLFMVFPILLISTVLRSVYRLSLDVKAFRNKTYVQTYNTEAKDALI